ncbi:hypothetical protein BH11ARM1_BH11ARM1_00130 [soil metagenome]
MARRLRLLLSFAALVLAALSLAQDLILVPLDNRPASGQYAEITAKIGGATPLVPPLRFFGNYTIPGSPDAILDWMAAQDLTKVKAMVISADMIAYGGLFESRKDRVSIATAKSRLARLIALKKKAPQAKLFLYSSLMRLTPSATHDASAFRMALAQYVVLRARNVDVGTQKTLKSQIPDGALESYDAARARSLSVQMELLRLASTNDVNFLVLGQDDAAQYGPQVEERARLSRQITNLNVGAKVQFCEGIDQTSSLLVSRALLESSRPTVKVIYSDPLGKTIIAPFESQPIQDTVAQQISVSGATMVAETVNADFTIYVNTPSPNHQGFLNFISKIEDDLDKAKPVVVADINLSKTSGAPDPELYGAIADKNRFVNIWNYSAWNTAANTIGSGVAAGNMCWLARRSTLTLSSQLAQKQLVLLRAANDFAYHTYTRQVAYQMTEGPRQSAIFGQDFYEVNDYVQRDLSKFLSKIFYENFLGRHFAVGDKEYEFIGMTDLVVGLPWPRPYEVRLEFELQAKPVE